MSELKEIFDALYLHWIGFCIGGAIFYLITGRARVAIMTTVLGIYFTFYITAFEALLK